MLSCSVLTHRAKSSEAKAFRETFVEVGLEELGQVEESSSVGIGIGVRRSVWFRRAP